MLRAGLLVQAGLRIVIPGVGRTILETLQRVVYGPVGGFEMANQGGFAIPVEMDDRQNDSHSRDLLYCLGSCCTSLGATGERTSALRESGALAAPHPPTHPSSSSRLTTVALYAILPETALLDEDFSLYQEKGKGKALSSPLLQVVRMPQKPAPLPPPYRHWERRVLYAYLRMMGNSQTAAAAAVGRSERTGQVWEADREGYLLAREDARKRWVGELTDVARVTLLKSLQDVTQGYLALQVLERLDEDLAPAKQRLDLSVEGKGLAALLDEARQAPRLPAAPPVAAQA